MSHHVQDAVPPVTIPASIEATFAAAFAPAPPGTVTILVTNDSSPARRANRITGTNPAEGSRFIVVEGRSDPRTLG